MERNKRVANNASAAPMPHPNKPSFAPQGRTNRMTPAL